MSESGELNSIKCPQCGAVSYHPADIAEGYCGRCHRFTRDEIDPRDRMTRSTHVAEPCPMCDEPVSWGQINSRTPRIGGEGGGRFAHRECMLRSVVGGIGHLEDHAFWCKTMGDPDGGRTYRQSALECDDWVAKHGVAAAVSIRTD